LAEVELVKALKKLARNSIFASSRLKMRARLICLTTLKSMLNTGDHGTNCAQCPDEAGRRIVDIEVRKPFVRIRESYCGNKALFELSLPLPPKYPTGRLAQTTDDLALCLTQTPDWA